MAGRAGLLLMSSAETEGCATPADPPQAEDLWEILPGQRLGCGRSGRRRYMLYPKHPDRNEPPVASCFAR